MGTHDVGARGWSVPARLAVMMFLQYFALGAWIVPLTRYLQTTPTEAVSAFRPPRPASST